MISFVHRSSPSPFQYHIDVLVGADALFFGFLPQLNQIIGIKKKRELRSLMKVGHFFCSIKF
jgi:hypothetical protein